MKRKIIVIGMDNTGKTTLVEDLKRILQVGSIKSTGPNRSRSEMTSEIFDNLANENVIILERFPIVEELIYGKILRNNPKFEFSDLIRVNEMYHPLFIYCRPSKSKILNFGEREQMSGVIENSEKLIKGFDHLYLKMMEEDFDIIRYDYENNIPIELVLYYTRKEK